MRCCFVYLYLSPVCVRPGGLRRAQRIEKEGSRQVFGAWGAFTGTGSWNWHNACWDGSGREPPVTRSCLGPRQCFGEATGVRSEGDQIRSRGENWGRFSCRCQTNDLIVGTFGRDSSGGWAQMGGGDIWITKADIQWANHDNIHMTDTG